MKKEKNQIKNISNVKEQQNILSESEAIYKKGAFTKFSSFEEANEEDAKVKANISPQQHLINVTQRIKEMYADELITPMDKTLKFRDDD